MKRKFILLPIFLFVCSLLFGQNIDKLSFVVNGQFDSINSNDKYFYLSFINEDNKEIIDSAKKLSPTGKFSLTGYIRKPVLAKLYTHRAILGELIIGPGFNLDITGDAKNFNVLSVTKKIIGNGSAPNQYIVKRDSVLYKLNIDVGLLQLKEDDFQKMISTRKKICDSVLSVVFNLGSPASAYLNIKKDIIKEEGFDNAVNVINYLINHPNFNYRYTVLFAKNNISEVILKDIYDEDNLRYPGYINLMGAYYFYLEALDSRKNNLPPVDFDDAIKHLETIASSYQGKIKFSTLSGRMHYALVFCRSYPEFELYNSTFPKYITMLPDQNVKEKIRSLLDITGKELIKINNGSKAPDFRSLDISGKLHTLTDYQNKVVLIDLWASWCGPCRYQTKFLKKTVEKFKNDNRVAFISISVNDKLPEWQKALLQDKPTWLQLIDSEKSAAKGYLAYSIPKFVLINKLGNIVTLDAPMPDDGNKLEKLINAEIAK